MKVTVQDTEVEFNRIHINAKCSDLCFSQLTDAQGHVVAEHDGYVPALMPDRGGDYVYLEIDLETGTILNWKRPTRKTVEETEWKLRG